MAFKKKYYVAYGSNLNVAQMAVRCPGATPYATGTLTDMRLLFKGSKTGAYLTVEPADGYDVPVGIWEVSPANERALDRYEGFPGFYDKREVVFHAPDGSTLEAFMYVMHRHFKLGVPSQAYINTCHIGYTDFGFDTSTLEEAIEYVQKEVKPSDPD